MLWNTQQKTHHIVEHTVEDATHCGTHSGRRHTMEHTVEDTTHSGTHSGTHHVVEHTMETKHIVRQTGEYMKHSGTQVAACLASIEVCKVSLRCNTFTQALLR